MAASTTAPVSLDSLKSEIDRLTSLVTLVVQANGKSQVPSAPAPAVPATDETIRAWLNANGKGHKGPLSNKDRAAYASSNGNGNPTPAAVSAVSTRFGTYAPSERGVRQPTREDAAKMLITDPDRQTMTGITSAEWRALSQNGTKLPNPAALNGNDRKVAYKLATGTVTPNLQLAACGIVRKLHAAGLL